MVKRQSLRLLWNEYMYPLILERRYLTFTTTKFVTSAESKLRPRICLIAIHVSFRLMGHGCPFLMEKSCKLWSIDRFRITFWVDLYMSVRLQWHFVFNVQFTNINQSLRNFAQSSLLQRRHLGAGIWYRSHISIPHNSRP